MSHTTFPRGTTLMNKDDEEEEEEVLEVSSSPSSSSKNNRAAACCMVSASRIKLSMAPANLSETKITVASSSPIAATFFFFFFYYRCSWTENWVPSSSSSSSYKDEKQRPLDPFSPPTQGNSSNSSSSAPTLAEPSKPLAQNAFKTLPNFIFLGSSSSYGTLHFPRSLCRAGFAARIHKSVANEGFTILALQTLLPHVVMLLLLLLANHVLLLQIGFSLLHRGCYER
jgi:hypothetical protein